MGAIWFNCSPKAELFLMIFLAEVPAAPHDMSVPTAAAHPIIRKLRNQIASL